MEWNRYKTAGDNEKSEQAGRDPQHDRLGPRLPEHY